MAWYDIEKKDEKKESKREYLARVNYEKIICQKTKSLTDVIGSELTKNVQYRFVTSNAINAIVVIDYLLKKYKLTEIYIAVYRMNEQAVNKLKSIIDTDNITCKILLSSFFRENKRYEKWAEELLLYAAEKNRVKVAFAVTHAKVFLAKTKDNRHIVFEGSGNLSDNARIEQYLIEDNETTYNFHKEWINNILDEN